MTLIEQLRALAAGATPGAEVPPSSHVRDVATRAADRLEQLDALAAAADAFLKIEGYYSPDCADATPLADALAAVEELDRG